MRRVDLRRPDPADDDAIVAGGKFAVETEFRRVGAPPRCCPLVRLEFGEAFHADAPQRAAPRAWSVKRGLCAGGISVAAALSAWSWGQSIAEPGKPQAARRPTRRLPMGRDQASRGFRSDPSGQQACALQPRSRRAA